VLNLAINARDAMQVGGRLTVETSDATLGPSLYPEDPPAGDYVVIRVADTGSGMSPEIRSKVFEPFFTTKEVGKGSGLGLSQVLGFAKQSGGGVRIESEEGKGTAVYIYLPRSEAKAATTAYGVKASTSRPAASGATILLVDDDQSVREITASLLQELGYTVIEAGSGGAALELLERKRTIDLMLLDFAMPGMNGAEVARHVQAKHPNLPILFVTGFADRAALEGVSDAHIIGKPFVDDELATKISIALANGVQGNVVQLRR
jgi:CheY-like chemotaxis protein